MKILIVEPGPQASKERFLRDLTNNPYEFFLIVNSSQRIPPDNWYYQYIPSANVFRVDFRNVREAAKSVRKQMVANGIHLSGVVTYYEPTVILTQSIAEELSLAPITTGEPLILHDKSKMRLKFTSVGLPQPRSILCRTLQDAKEATKEIGLPFVVKPSQMAGSVGVSKVSSKSEIDDALNAAFTEDLQKEDYRFAYNIPSEVIVEEYIYTYQELSCEGVIQHGKVQIVALTKKFLGQEPLFLEIAHMTPYQVTNEIKTVIEEQLNRVVQALNLYNTAFHAEFRLRTEAPPVIIEIGLRLPGGFVPQLIQLSQGINMFQAILQLATDQKCNVMPTRDAVAGVQFLVDKNAVRKFAAASHHIRSLPFIDEAVAYDNASGFRRGHIIWSAQDADELYKRWKIISDCL